MGLEILFGRIREEENYEQFQVNFSYKITVFVTRILQTDDFIRTYMERYTRTDCSGIWQQSFGLKGFSGINDFFTAVFS